VPSGKHAPTRLSSYATVHHNVLDQFVRDGFVDAGHDLDFTATEGGFLLEGVLRCAGGIEIEVRKLVGIVLEEVDPLVRTRWYSYNVSVHGLGNIFRYDSPHVFDPQGHHAEHHVHRYDVLTGDREGLLEFIHGEDAHPTLGRSSVLLRPERRCAARHVCGSRRSKYWVRLSSPGHMQ